MKTKVQQLKGGSYISIIPKSLVQITGWKKGTRLQWKLTPDGKLIIEEVKQ